ncbi:uncharacterized protein [Arachis hypogaea]|uniref:uncharacterized protein n=1 Tax=Arachis hypogaea TaxID=3818 RepID=UPI003B20ED08
MDGASNEDGRGAGIVLRDNNGLTTEQSIKYIFPVSNNESEYEALLAGLCLAKECGIQNIKVYCDSQLVVQQLNDVFQLVISKRLEDPILHLLEARRGTTGRVKPETLQKKGQYLHHHR